MPSQILHALFGEDVLTGLYPHPPDNRGAFVLGCQGPDIFYHNRRTRPVSLEYGSLLHRRGYGTFSAHLFAMCRRDPCLRDYALGFITHAALDRFCHPYIIYKSVHLQAKNPKDAELTHPFFERILDVLMLKELRRQDLSDWDQKTLANTCENPPPGLKDAIARAMISAFPQKARDALLARRIDNAFADSGRYYRMSDPANTGIEQRLSVNKRYLSLVSPLNLPAEIDFLNLKHENWYYPYCPLGTVSKPDSRSFPQIYAEAVDAAAASLLSCVAHSDTDIFPIAGIAENIGDGGLSIHDETGKPCMPNCTSPLPLNEVIQDQAEIRNLGLKKL